MSDEHTAQDELVVKLTAAVEALSSVVEVLSGRLRRKRISDALLAFVVVGMLVSGALYYFVELPGRRADTRNQIRDLACYAVRLRAPGYSPTSDALRARYRCPPYDPAAAASASAANPTPTSPTSTSGASDPPRGAQRPSTGAAPATATRAPSSSRSTVATRTAAPRPPATSSSRRPVAAPTGGRDASPTPLVQLPTLCIRIGQLIATCPS